MGCVEWWRSAGGKVQKFVSRLALPAQGLICRMLRTTKFVDRAVGLILPMSGTTFEAGDDDEDEAVVLDSLLGSLKTLARVKLRWACAPPSAVKVEQNSSVNLPFATDVMASRQLHSPQLHCQGSVAI